MVELSFVNPEGVHPPAAGYTQVVSVAGPVKVLYISGQVPKNQENEIVGKGNLEAQTRQVYQNLEIVLRSMGATFDDVVKQTIYTTQISQVHIIRTVRAEFLNDKRPPASTLVGVTSLVDPAFLIEIEAVAVLKE